MSKTKEIRLPAFLGVNRNGKERFIDCESVLDDPALQAEVVRHAVSELEPWCSRYAELFKQLGAKEALEIIDSIVSADIALNESEVVDEDDGAQSVKIIYL